MVDLTAHFLFAPQTCQTLRCFLGGYIINTNPSQSKEEVVFLTHVANSNNYFLKFHL